MKKSIVLALVIAVGFVVALQKESIAQRILEAGMKKQMGRNVLDEFYDILACHHVARFGGEHRDAIVLLNLAETVLEKSVLTNCCVVRAGWCAAVVGISTDTTPCTFYSQRPGVTFRS